LILQPDALRPLQGDPYISEAPPTVGVLALARKCGAEGHGRCHGAAIEHGAENLTADRTVMPTVA